ncbi:helix-turn-helix transcriptional regulator [Verrucosispora sp. NA02020]|uniref:helix-turn-helix transcriptional regulator n=1 Tax=Verrucosispora sp. NA02020 TaxID=2742132 RepID=UPI00159095FE|nr:helix-turn-helix domain-containing protein [Verrucosispora sp. NA02020]QKW15305.1 helix-turn-helix domain-containing protein [Verrucosispora sp. NA02020]
MAAEQNDSGNRFSRLLREYRVRVGLRQEDVADRSGVSLETISRWERGQVTNPKPEQVQAVCRVLGLSTVTAGVALGYLAPADVEHLPPPPRRQDPTVEEAVSILEDPDMPDATKQAALSYLRYLHSTQPGPTTGNRAAS